jgi:signal transduction histidine kinase
MATFDPRPEDGSPPRLRLTGGEAAGAGPAPRELLHELSNLLDGSLRNVGLALKRIAPEDGPRAMALDGRADHQALTHLKTADAALRQMADLLGRWRDDAGRDRPATCREREATLGEVVDQAVGLLRPVAEERGIALEVEVESAVVDLPLGVVYPVVVNALRNAIEAIDGEGRVSVTAEADGAAVEIVISDDGPGVATDLPRDSEGLVLAGRTTKAGGQGLGLAISRDLVRGLGGWLRLIDRPTGGAALIIHLPRPGGARP